MSETVKIIKLKNIIFHKNAELSELKSQIKSKYQYLTDINNLKKENKRLKEDVISIDLLTSEIKELKRQSKKLSEQAARYYDKAMAFDNELTYVGRLNKEAVRAKGKY